MAHDTLRLSSASSLPLPRKLRAALEADLAKVGAQLPKHSDELATLLRLPPAVAPANGMAAAATAAAMTKSMGAVEVAGEAGAASAAAPTDVSKSQQQSQVSVVSKGEDSEDVDTEPIGAEWFTLFSPSSSSPMAVPRPADSTAAVAAVAADAADGLESCTHPFP